MAVWVGRVARSPIVAQVERQEPSLLTGQLRGHGDTVGVDREVDQGPPRQRDVAGSRSVRYWAMACSMFWLVSGFFSSAVAVGMPLTSRARSMVLCDFGS